MLRLDCFDTIVFTCDNPIKPDNRECVKRINCSRNIFSPSPVMIVADPFLVFRDDVLFLFYEEYRHGGRGIIKMTSTEDLVSWTEPQVVLTEKFHLSYPFVFQHDGQWYMMPETSAAHEIRLYKAVNNKFDQFEYYTTLLAHRPGEARPAMDYCDSSIIKKDDVFYLFTTVNRGEGNELHLFYSDRLDGEYMPHPQSPLFVSDKYGRNGGTPLEYHGDIYRFAQDCDGQYGKNINIFKVNDLTQTRYQEALVVKDALSLSGWSAGHQYNFVNFKGHYVVTVDQKFKLPLLGCKVKRLFKKLMK